MLYISLVYQFLVGGTFIIDGNEGGYLVKKQYEALGWYHWHVPLFFLFCFFFQIHGIGTSIYPSIIFMIYEKKIKTFVMFITIVWLSLA